MISQGNITYFPHPCKTSDEPLVYNGFLTYPTRDTTLLTVYHIKPFQLCWQLIYAYHQFIKGGSLAWWLPALRRLIHWSACTGQPTT